MRLQHRLSLVVVLLLVSARFAHAQTVADPAGHWEGAIQAPFGEIVIEIDLMKKSDGNVMATFSRPSLNIRGLPLANAKVDGRAVSFELKANAGGGTFAGALLADNKSIAGDYMTTEGFVVPFNLSRTGEARIEPAPKSAPIGKELEGRWTGAVGQLGLVLTLANLPDGTAMGAIATDQGLEIPIAVTQNGVNVTIDVKATGASIVVTLNAEGTELVGTYNERSTVAPLTFKRVPVLR